MAIDNIALAIATTDNCRYCLMCRHVCPVGHVTMLETLTPHGWGLLIASERRGLIAWNASSVEKLFSCADCGACRAHCVTDQPLPNAIAAARAAVVEQNLAPATVVAAGEALAQWGNPYKPIKPQPATGTGEVALFVGDEAAYLWPEVLPAVLKLLAATGVTPVLIGAGRNNGYLATSLGFPAMGKSLAQAVLDDLRASGARQLLVLTPGDYYVFRDLYDERLGLSLPKDVEVTEVLVYLAERLAAGDLAFLRFEGAPAFAYVDPAHSVRVTTRYEAPRQLLAAVMPSPGSELFWRRDRTHPAGSTSLKFANPQLADHLTYARLGDAVQVGARLLICEDPGTLNALAAHSARFGVRVQGLYELLADHLISDH